MSIIESIAKYKDHALGLVVGKHGFTLHFENGNLSGHEVMSTAARKYIDQHGIPTVVQAENLSRDVAYSLPLIGLTMDEGPIASMSRVSFDVYASICALHGAQLINVTPLNLLPAMFHETQASQAAAMAAIFGREGIAWPLVDNDAPAPVWSIPSNPALDVFHRCAQNIAHTRTTHEKAAASLAEKDLAEEVKYREVGQAAGWVNVPARSLDTFTDHLAQQAMVTRCSGLINIVTWNALMVEAGNLSATEAWGAIDEYSHLCMAKSQAVVARVDAVDYSHLHKAHEMLKTLHGWTGQMCKAASHIAQREDDAQYGAPAA